MIKKIFSEQKTIYRYDKFIVGFVPALIAPIVGIALFYVAKFAYMPVEDYIEMVLTPKIFAPIMSLGVVMNLFLFFLFIWRNYYIAARSVILVSILYAIPILIAKYFL